MYFKKSHEPPSTAQKAHPQPPRKPINPQTLTLHHIFYKTAKENSLQGPEEAPQRLPRNPQTPKDPPKSHSFPLKGDPQEPRG